MLTTFYRCACFLTNNIFLKNLNEHVEHKSRESFLKKNKKILQDLSDEQIENLLGEIEVEKSRRLQLDADSTIRKDLILRNYKHLHPSLLQFKVNIFKKDALGL
jgi:hypothetical protein